MLHPFIDLIRRRKVEITFVASEILATDLTTYTFASINLPVQRSNNQRIIVAAFHGEDITLSFSISSASFGGVGMTARGQSATTGNTTGVRFFSLGNASASVLSSGQASCTFSEAVTGAGYGLWVVDGINVPIYTNIDAAAAEFTGTRNHGNGGLINDAWFWAGTSADASPSGVMLHTGPHGFKSAGDYNDLGTEFSIAGTSFLHGQYGMTQRIEDNFEFSGAGNCSDVLLRIRETPLVE